VAFLQESNNIFISLVIASSVFQYILLVTILIYEWSASN
jgi:hypothetical protein